MRLPETLSIGFLLLGVHVASMDAVTHPPHPVNEPNLTYAPGTPERKELEQELARQQR